MNTTEIIGLDKTEVAAINEKLNELLANLSVFYQNVRGFHWNISGKKFFELHVKFEELYNDLIMKIDEVAERILTLGGTPEHNFSFYLKATTVEESGKVEEGDAAVQAILKSFGTLLKIERDILDRAQKASDEGTAAMMSDYIREQEKLVWMYTAFLN